MQLNTISSLFLVICLVFLPASLLSASSDKSGTVGFVKSVTGEAYLMNGDKDTRIVPNMRIAPGESVKTGSNASIGLIFDDDTVVSLGPNSIILIESFAFQPAENQLSFVARLVQGTFSFITGQIAKLAPEKVRFETPNATLGVRGTQFIVNVE